MSKQLKAGDLALVVRSAHSENLGRVVELVRATDEEMIMLPDGRATRNPGRLKVWEVIADGLFVTSGLRPEGFITDRGAVPENRLMPLRGDFQPESEKAAEVTA